MIDKQTLKLRCSEAIDQNREAILAFADDIYRHPELGYHEFRSTEKIKEVFSGLGLSVEDGIAYTGCSAKAGRADGPVVAIMGELDCLHCPDHPDCDGFIGKDVRFIGRAAHAGFAPSEGINALNMAQLALNGIHTLRETFRDEDKVRVSAIITKCGEMVNTVPAEAEMQLMVRAASLDAMLDSSRKVDRALKAGALAVGGKVEIENQIGYLPLHTSRELTALYRENVKAYLGCDDSAFIPQYVSAGSTDLGDLSHIVPCMHIWTGGISGALHASDFKVTDPETAFILPAKMMAMTVIDLLFDKASCAKAVMDAFHPTFTKEQYLAFLKEHSRLDFFDCSTL